MKLKNCKILFILLLSALLSCLMSITAFAGTYNNTISVDASFAEPEVSVKNAAGGTNTGKPYRFPSPVTNVTKITSYFRLNSKTSSEPLNNIQIYYSSNGVNFTYGTTIACPMGEQVPFTINFGSSLKTVTALFFMPATKTWPGYNYTVSNPYVTQTLTDNTAPVITLSQQGYYSRSYITVTATISDTQSGVSIKKWAQGYQSLSYFNSSGTSFSGSYFYPTSNGYYTVYAKDISGNAAVNYIYVTMIDNTPPTISAITSTEYAATNNVTVNISDSQSGVSIKKWAYGYCSSSYFASGGTSFTGNMFTVTQNGYVTIYSRDAAGNETVSSVYVSYVDNTPPTIYASSSTEYAPTNIVTATVTDSQSGVLIKKWANGVCTASYFSSGGNTLSGNTFTVYENGSYTVYAKDSVGNETVLYVTVSYVDNIISITHTISVNYSLNPNSGNPFNAGNAILTNNSRIKVRVFVQSFTAVSGGITFTDVSPTYFTNWNSLTAAQTKRYIALGVQVTTNLTGWHFIYTTAPVYGANISSPVLLGTLNPNGAQGGLSFSAKCGMGWDGDYTAKHSLTLLFQTE